MPLRLRRVVRFFGIFALLDLALSLALAIGSVGGTRFGAFVAIVSGSGAKAPIVDEQGRVFVPASTQTFSPLGLAFHVGMVLACAVVAASVQDALARRRG